MRIPCRWLIGTALALAATGAWAGGARITFYGAVVEPTCSVGQPAGDLASGSRVTCGRSATDPGRSYAREVLGLDAATIAGDRLLGYFASYANAPAAARAPAKLVVRTYE